MLYSQAVTGRQPPAPSTSKTSTTAQSTSPSTPRPGITSQIHTKTAPTTTHHHQNPPRPRHQPNPDHKPRTATPEASVYVLTLTTTPSLSEPLNALREAHFPAHLNRTPAHLTLFHALPGSEMPRITAALEELCGAQRPLRLATGRAFRMRRGVGIGVADGGPRAAAQQLHGALQGRWWDVLSEQDRSGWRPHWTVQNKAADEAAVDAAMGEVRSGFRGAEGVATGCALWRYEKGGRWTFERGFDFDGDK
ncbi:hypothetical protein N8I77_007274 [Diaporthe amygdali]|uniref:2'-5' RNA ligase superfamily-domain-containing protein n=1 Tax=Phomopsis amygdali TaxID=1214568 RepID=A0AAD9SCU5_PHOAM|nr:hypothetical protein N8I77_007274 [Diaporthe amygdali]